MSIPKAVVDIAKVIQAEIDLCPKQDNCVVIPLDNFRDDTRAFVGKSTLEKILRRLQESKVIKLVNITDLYNHILPLQSDKVEVQVDREQLGHLLSSDAAELPTPSTAGSIPTEAPNPTPKEHKPPAGWGLQESEGQAQILKNELVIFTFPNLWADKYLYFKYVWSKYNQVIPYKELFESKSDSKYPNKKGENWKVNKAIRITMNKLRKEFERKEVPITIQTEGGIKVCVTE